MTGGAGVIGQTPVLSVTLPWPHRVLSPNGRSHFMHKASAAKKAKEYAYFIAKEALPLGFKHDGSRLRLTIMAYPKTKRRPDDDNTAGSLKAHRDGIALALGIDDSLFDQQPIVWGEPFKGGKIVVTVG